MLNGRGVKSQIGPVGAQKKIRAKAESSRKDPLGVSSRSGLGRSGCGGSLRIADRRVSRPAVGFVSRRAMSW